MKRSELRQIIREEISKVLMEQKNPTITKIEKDTGYKINPRGFILRSVTDTDYKITLSNGKTVQSDDDDLLGRYAQIGKGGRKDLKQLNKILVGQEWDLDY